MWEICKYPHLWCRLTRWQMSVAWARAEQTNQTSSNGATDHDPELDPQQAALVAEINDGRTHCSSEYKMIPALSCGILKVLMLTVLMVMKKNIYIYLEMMS